jgi:hypothetical protein
MEAMTSGAFPNREFRYTTLSETFARRLERFREHTATVSKARERRRQKLTRVYIARSTGKRHDYRDICSAVTRCAVDLQRGNGRTVEFARAAGSSWEMIAQDFRVDVMGVIRRTAARYPRHAKLATRGDRRYFRERLGMAFERAGLYPISNYFADMRPQGTRTEDRDYIPPDLEWRKLLVREQERQRAREYRHALRAEMQAQQLATHG